MMLVSCSLGRSGGEGLGISAVASAGTRAFFDHFADEVASYPELICGSRHLATEPFEVQPHRAPR